TARPTRAAIRSKSSASRTPPTSACTWSASIWRRTCGTSRRCSGCSRGPGGAPAPTSTPAPRATSSGRRAPSIRSRKACSSAAPSSATRPCTTGSPCRRSFVSPSASPCARFRSSSTIPSVFSECGAGLQPCDRDRSPKGLRHLPVARLFGLEIGGLRLVDVPGGGLVGKESVFPQLLRRAADARDVLVARQLLIPLEQAEPTPGLRRRLAIVPDAVAIHVDEHFLPVERLEAFAGERGERCRARCALRI